MAKFIKGELAVDRLDRVFVFINNCIKGFDCVVYNPRTSNFEINNSATLRPLDKMCSHKYFIDFDNIVVDLHSQYDYLMSGVVKDSTSNHQEES